MSKPPGLLPSRCFETVDKNSQEVTMHNVCTGRDMRSWNPRQCWHVSSGAAVRQNPLSEILTLCSCTPPFCSSRLCTPTALPRLPLCCCLGRVAPNDRGQGSFLLGAPSSSSVCDVSWTSFSHVLTCCPLPLSGNCTCGSANDCWLPNRVGSCQSLILAVTSLLWASPSPSVDPELLEDRAQV